MPTYFLLDGIKIDLYFDDHAPPHFHAVYAEYEELIEIETLETYQGKLPTKQRKKVINWAKENQGILMEIWENNH
ncbi:MAG TPA: DUF4160 domain-containing protein [Saprospiraceae bacterium]|nr:DUF4160 domain-containing protein [Saprospiraceae bacterium]HMP26051.1 DUF4160 domain-containing protein [Saprospiraceae bacterium]